MTYLKSAGPAAAQDFNLSRTTFVTFSGPVQLPNLTLPAGDYMFRLNDTSGNRRIVEVRSKDGLQHFGYILAISATRPEPAEETVITFRETPAGQPPAIRYWYYPGNVIGHEFVYPREQATRIAQATREEVLTSDDTGSLERMRGADVAAVDAEGRERAIPDEATAAEQTIAQDTGRMEEAAPVGTAGRTLPRTASSLPLIGLIGLLSIVGAASIRAFAGARA
jgi:hypothetical protein